MSLVVKMLKQAQLEFGVTMEAEPRDGPLSMLTRLIRIEPRASIKNLDSTLTDHSISDQDFHSKELLNATVPTTFG
jgi:hypothetical protein